jgi:23S rRNA (uracil1939-C5)-methyltransferase
LRAFAGSHPGVQWWLQSKGPETVALLDAAKEAGISAAKGDGRPLSYTLPEFGITMPFRPTDFTQVNPWINRVLVARALRLLDVKKHERVIDWFCGLGNFTLPLATQARQVLGIEGADSLIARSRENYELNKRKTATGITLCDTQFVARDLFGMTPDLLRQDGQADKWLVDPPREGAFALVKAVAELHQQNTALPHQDAGWQRPKRIVYVSCNPATLARDAGVLVEQAGYRCTQAGVVNMFPHTAHVESIAVFDVGG